MTVGVSARAACSRLVGAAFLAGMLAAVSVSSTSSWAQSSPEQEGVNKPIKKKPSRKIAASPVATTELAKGEGQSSAGIAAQSPLANCKQEYAAKKAAGATEANSQASHLKACRPADPPPGAGAEASQGGGDINKLREAAQNPVANLVSVQLQNNLNFGYGPYNAAQNALNFQPIVPFHLNDDWNLITRWVSPIVYQPRLGPDVGSEFGIGNLEPQFYLSPAHPGDLIWGVGPAVYLRPPPTRRLASTPGAPDPPS